MRVKPARVRIRCRISMFASSSSTMRMRALLKAADVMGSAMRTDWRSLPRPAIPATRAVDPQYTTHAPAAPGRATSPTPTTQDHEEQERRRAAPPPAIARPRPIARPGQPLAHEPVADPDGRREEQEHRRRRRGFDAMNRPPASSAPMRAAPILHHQPDPRDRGTAGRRRARRRGGSVRGSVAESTRRPPRCQTQPLDDARAAASPESGAPQAPKKPRPRVGRSRA